MDDVVWHAIVEANKLGGRGLQVVGCIEPTSAGQSADYKLVIRAPNDPSWYD